MYNFFPPPRIFLISNFKILQKLITTRQILKDTQFLQISIEHSQNRCPTTAQKASITAPAYRPTTNSRKTNSPGAPIISSGPSSMIRTFLTDYRSVAHLLRRLKQTRRLLCQKSYRSRRASPTTCLISTWTTMISLRIQKKPISTVAIRMIFSSRMCCT